MSPRRRENALHWLASITPFPARADTLNRLSKQAAERAIQLDPEEPVAYEALGFVLYVRWDWQGSLGAYAKAATLNPSSAAGGLGILYQRLGRHREALEALQTWRNLDPLSPVIRVWLGWAFVCAGEYEKGLPLLDPSTLPSPDPWQRFRRAHALTRAGRYREAIDDFEALMRPGQFPPDGLAYAYAKAGDSLRARAVVEERARRLGELSAPDREQTSRSGSLADALAVGDHEQLIRRLQEMYDRKSYSMPSRCEPYYADLLEIEGARALLEKLGLPL